MDGTGARTSSQCGTAKYDRYGTADCYPVIFPFCRADRVRRRSPLQSQAKQKHTVILVPNPGTGAMLLPVFTRNFIKQIEAKWKSRSILK
jgi:hypothetical protein